VNYKDLTRGRTGHFSNMSSYDLKPSPMTLKFICNLDNVKMNQQAKHLDQRPFG